MAGSPKKIGFLQVLSIGIGGMVGGGIFAVLGLSVEIAHGGTPLAFALAGVVALVTSYSYASLSLAFPSRGGTVEFLNRSFGGGLVTGSLNILLLISYVIMISLYAHAFGSYGASFFSSHQTLWRHILASAAILVLTLLNAFGAYIVSKAEEWVVAFKIAILLLFIGVGLWSIDSSRLAPATWSPTLSLMAGGMIIFVAYEGFELIANTAEDVRDIKVLPAAYYASVLFVAVIYILVALVTVGNLPLDQIISARDYALAESAKPFLGSIGFTLIAVAALLSTASAINATFYGSSRLSYIVAKEGELPAALERKVWQRPIEGLLIISGITFFITNLLDLGSISTSGSAGFLAIFAAVNLACWRTRDKTGAKGWIALSGAAICVLALGALVWDTANRSPYKLFVLAGLAVFPVLIELSYRELRPGGKYLFMRRGDSAAGPSESSAGSS